MTFQIKLFVDAGLLEVYSGSWRVAIYSSRIDKWLVSSVFSPEEFLGWVEEMALPSKEKLLEVLVKRV